MQKTLKKMLPDPRLARQFMRFIPDEYVEVLGNATMGVDDDMPGFSLARILTNAFRAGGELALGCRGLSHLYLAAAHTVIAANVDGDACNDEAVVNAAVHLAEALHNLAEARRWDRAVAHGRTPRQRSDYFNSLVTYKLALILLEGVKK